jgi:deoxycytidine triphosphate deaminase
MNKPEWPRLFGVHGAREGVLVDAEIQRALEQGQLVTGGTPDQAKYACYELRIGPDIQQLVLDHKPGTRNDLYRGKEVNQDGTFQIFPGETFKIIASEKLYIPADVFAIAIPVGNLYRLGLNPETTFADPGFAREFFVTVSNYSPRIITLKVGDPLSRLFFFKLMDRPQKIHDGEPRAMRPTVERIHRPELADLQRKGPSALLQEVLEDVDPPHYQHAFVTSEFLSLRRNLAVATLTSMATLLVVVFLAVLYSGQLLHTTWPSLFENVLSNAVYALIISIVIFVVTPIRRAAWHALGVLTSRNPQ